MRHLLTLAVAFFTFAAAAHAAPAGLDPENTLIMELKTGKVTIKLLPDIAPKHVERATRRVRAREARNTPTCRRNLHRRRLSGAP
jgi:hypothetical protein